MEYTKKSGVDFLDVSFTPELLSLFREFLREKMFSPVVKGVEFTNGSPGESTAYYSGCFNVEAAGEIEAWLLEKGVKLKEGEK